MLKNETNCGNAIAEIGEEKKIFVAIVAMPLPKMGGKKIVVAEIWGGIKKKKILRSQYFYNKSQMISYNSFKFEFNTEITFLIQQ